MKHLLWRLAGSKIAPRGARSWIGHKTVKRFNVNWFVMRFFEPLQHGGPRFPHDLDREFGGGYVGYVGRQWTCTFGVGWKGQE